jgi:hypothetical protein
MERVLRDHGRDDRGENDHGHQDAELGLSNDAGVEPEDGRDRPEGEPGGDQESRGFLVKTETGLQVKRGEWARQNSRTASLSSPGCSRLLT